MASARIIQWNQAGVKKWNPIFYDDIISSPIILWGDCGYINISRLHTHFYWEKHADIDIPMYVLMIQQERIHFRSASRMAYEQGR